MDKNPIEYRTATAEERQYLREIPEITEMNKDTWLDKYIREQAERDICSVLRKFGFWFVWRELIRFQLRRIVYLIRRRS